MSPSSRNAFEDAQAWAETDRLIAIARNWTRLDDPKIWESTDRLIAQAQELERQVIQLHPPHERDCPASTRTYDISSRRQPKRRANLGAISKYWSGDAETSNVKDHDSSARDQSPYTNSILHRFPGPGRKSTTGEAGPKTGARTRPAGQSGEDAVKLRRDALKSGTDLGYTCMRHATALDNNAEPKPQDETARGPRSLVSPYFCTPQPPKKNQRSPRPPPGTISSVPFPPLTASSFGIVQEEVARDPFWLLVAITFLIKTKGTQAIPTFWKVKTRFPTPADVADPGIEDELLGMIHHLGLSIVRVSYLQKYARAFLDNPPQAGVKHRIKKYSKPTQRGRSQTVDVDTIGLNVQMSSSEEPEAWEIGHMTSGKYAIDSWRIFCRDELLGEAQDWNGRGREPEFQPEWMRVLPEDKELRAYLRWMWMKEGWEWDPATGQRKVLREEMQDAVNQGRVGYDNTGGLKIIASDTD